MLVLSGPACGRRQRQRVRAAAQPTTPGKVPQWIYARNSTAGSKLSLSAVRTKQQGNTGRRAESAKHGGLSGRRLVPPWPCCRDCQVHGKQQTHRRECCKGGWEGARVRVPFLLGLGAVHAVQHVAGRADHQPAAKPRESLPAQAACSRQESATCVCSFEFENKFNDDRAADIGLSRLVHAAG